MSQEESRVAERTALAAVESTAQQVSTQGGGRRTSMRLLGFALLVLVVVGACGRKTEPGSDEPQPLEMVEVDEGPEADFTTEFDEFAAPRPAEEMAGVLPSDFPSDVSVFSPSSIVDFGSPGDRFVELDTPVPVERVRLSLESQLSKAGWSSASSEGEALVFTKTGRQLRVVLVDLSAGTRIRYEY